MLAIARALRARGVPVAMATHGGPHAGILDRAGEPYTLLEPTMDSARCRRYVDAVVEIGRPGSRLQPLDELLESVAAEVAFLREKRATMVVIGFSLSAYLSSRVAGVPLATSHGGSFIPPVFERGLAPIPTQAPVAQADWLPGFFLRFLANVMPPRASGPVAFLNEAARELRVEPVPSLAALMVGDLTLVTDVPEVLGIPEDELAAWRPRGRAYRPSTRLAYSGPLFARLEVPVPQDVEAFLDGTRPTAYVAPTSSSPALLRDLVAGVRKAGLRVIVAATVHDVADLASGDVVVAGVLPSHEIMPRVEVALIMGGQGSVQTAMASGTPFVGFPLQPEQELNVALGVRHGMAIGVGPRRATADTIGAAVRRLTEGGAYREAAQRVRGHYAGIDGAARAADVILSHPSQRAVVLGGSSA